MCCILGVFVDHCMHMFIQTVVWTIAMLTVEFLMMSLIVYVHHPMRYSICKTQFLLTSSSHPSLPIICCSVWPLGWWL